ASGETPKGTRVAIMTKKSNGFASSPRWRKASLRSRATSPQNAALTDRSGIGCIFYNLPMPVKLLNVQSLQCCQVYWLVTRQNNDTAAGKMSGHQCFQCPDTTGIDSCEGFIQNPQ